MLHHPKQLACDESLLQGYLDETLSDAQQAAVEEHLDHCAVCRERIGQSAAGGDWWHSAERYLSQDQWDDEGAVGAPVGDSQPHAAAMVGDQVMLHQVQQWLDPTDDPHMMGRFAGYEIVGVIGHGGMGVVLKGFEASLNRFVAIKVLSPALAGSGSARRRFARESQAAAAILHNNIVAIHRVDQWQGLPFLVMPYLSDIPLQKRIDDEGPLPLAAILRVGEQVASGLAAAHAHGLVHRDVKPANILIGSGIERVTLTDFGLARAADDASLTKSGVVAGTPQFMSPEQARGETVDQRSDLFSLGSVLYTMCTGRPPFRAETSYGILRQITDTEPRPIREVNPDIPDWFCAIIAKLMSKQAEDRFASAAEVAELLEDCLAHIQQPTTVPLPAGVQSFGAPPRESSKSAPKGWTPARLIAVATFAFALLCAGIVIVLEHNKGKLTIECDTDHVPIRIMQGDTVVDRLKVSKSGATVRVAAGNYVVEFDGNPDGIAIKNGTVELRRGEERLVRIVSTATAPGMITPEPPPDVGLPSRNFPGMPATPDPFTPGGRTTPDPFTPGMLPAPSNTPGALSPVPPGMESFGAGASPGTVGERGSKSEGPEKDDAPPKTEQTPTPTAGNLSSARIVPLSDVQTNQGLRKSSYDEHRRRTLLDLEEQRDELLITIATIQELLVDANEPLEIPEGASRLQKERLASLQRIQAEKREQLNGRLKQVRQELGTVEKKIATARDGIDDPLPKTEQTPTPKADNLSDKERKQRVQAMAFERLKAIVELETAAGRESELSERRRELLSRAAVDYEQHYRAHAPHLTALLAGALQVRCLRKLGEQQRAAQLAAELLGLPDDRLEMRIAKGMVSPKYHEAQRTRMNELEEQFKLATETNGEWRDVMHDWSDAITTCNEIEHWLAESPKEQDAAKRRLEALQRRFEDAVKATRPLIPKPEPTVTLKLVRVRGIESFSQPLEGPLKGQKVREALLACDVVINNQMGEDLTVLSNFFSAFDGLDIVLLKQGAVVRTQSYIFHQSPLAEDRPYVLKQGQNETQMRFPISGVPEDWANLEVKLIGRLPGSTFKGTLTSETRKTQQVRHGFDD